MVVVSFVNMKGGVGKTTLAVNMADFLTKRHSKNVLLVDVDPQFNATQCILNDDDYMSYLKEDNNISIVDVFNYTKAAVVSVTCGVQEKPSLSLENIKPLKTERGFDLIHGRLDLFRFEMAPGQGTENKLKNYLNYLKVNEKYDICIIDCPPTPSVWMTSAIIASDYYLIPTKPEPISMVGLDLLDGIIRERKENYGCSCKCSGLVLTMVERKTNVYKKALKYLSTSEKWKTFLYKPVLLKRTSVATEQLNGKFIWDIEDSDLKYQFSGITQEFLKRIEVD